MQLKQALNAAASRLTAAQVPLAADDAELLLRFVLSCDRAYLFAHPERELTPDEHIRSKLPLRNAPAAYRRSTSQAIRNFAGMDLIVTPAVLIPRPETEHIIETVLEVQASAADFAPTTFVSRM